MNAIRRFFSFQGRSSRLPWWIVTLGVYATLVVLGAFFLFTFDPSGEFTDASSDADVEFGGVLGVLVLSAVVIALTLPITVRRLHDRNKSGWWAMAYAIVPAFIVELDVYRPLGLDVPADLVTLGNVIGYGLSLVATVDLGLVRGTQGPNRYGPDPLDRDAYDPREAQVFD